jgi:hypothetical protein
LNLGIAAARGEIIARMDAHAAPSPGYVRRCVAVLSESDAAVVGMPCRVRPGADGVVARSIAMAVSHPFGIGDAKYRLGSQDDGRATQEDVDTVAFACFRKSVWLELGGFDEQLLTNEDYDFNYRVRASGARVVLDRFSALRLLRAFHLRQACSAIFSLRHLEGAHAQAAAAVHETTAISGATVCLIHCCAQRTRFLAQRFLGTPRN